MEKKPTKKITEYTSHYESSSFKIMAKLGHRLIHGFFYFKKRKGEILAGSATFFSILSFCPIILLFISMTGYVTNDFEMAKTHVLEVVNSSFPNLAPWIMDSISKIVEGQLKGISGTNIVNVFLLFYATLGVVSSLMFGLHHTSKTEQKGGFIFEDMKSLGVGLMFTSFIFSLLVISNKNLFYALTKMSESSMVYMDFLYKGGMLPAILSLVFFTFFFKVGTTRKISISDAFYGSLTFVSCFVMGKSFHWIYMTMAKSSLTQTYGNFETIIIAVLWVYYLMCSFYFGASVAYLKYDEIYGGLLKSTPQTPSQDIKAKNDPPEVPNKAA
tara:strand:+ start:10827 stop:11810 length:984 start_codon:yes stop_codon:yes gene_type:complete